MKTTSKKRLRIIWRTRRWRVKIIFPRRGANGRMFEPTLQRFNASTL
jgi:hypothetical protein